MFVSYFIQNYYFHPEESKESSIFGKLLLVSTINTSNTKKKNPNCYYSIIHQQHKNCCNLLACITVDRYIDKRYLLKKIFIMV